MKSLSIALLLSSWMAVCAEEQPIQQKEEKLDSLRGMQQALEENEQNHSSRGSTRAERLKRMADLTVEERRELVRASEESCGSSSQFVRIGPPYDVMPFFPFESNNRF